MKIFLSLALLGVVGLGVGASPAPGSFQKGDLLVGDNKCTWGPSYWCQNFSSAAGCQATKHCIQTVWEHQTYPTDHDDVCTICKKMVKEARDTLNSNETEEEIKQVFEGSCELIYIKPIVKECVRIVDEFAPQLIDALSSQMDPNTVCSVAGLCNSAAFDKMLEDNKATEIKSPDLERDEMKVSSQRQKCTNCVYVMNKVRTNLAETPEDVFTKKLLSKCRDMGSFSDSCSTLAVSHAATIYSFLQDKFKEEDACFLGGFCVGVKPHPLMLAVEVMPKARFNVNDEEFEEGDIACDMCVTLVDHFRENVALNTTALEFKKVLLGICRHLRSFNQDCFNLVEAYWQTIYDYLKDGLVAKEICTDVGICHGTAAPGSQLSTATKGEEINLEYMKANAKQPISPLLIGDILLPANLEANLKQSERQNPKRPKLHSVPLEKDTLPAVLPLELYVPHEPLMSNTLCTFCNYFLHFAQVEITDPTNEKHIKDVVKTSCKRMPNEMYQECMQFVDQFGDAVIAMLVHQIDPSQICPSLHVCPTEAKVEGKSCPLCLLAVKSIEDKLENNKTEENIKITLESLCSHLPGDVRKECDTFILEYFDDLVDMLVADFTPQDVCLYLKLCTAPKLAGGDIATNEIYDGGDLKVYKEPLLKEVRPLPASGEGCFFCVLIMNAVESAASNRKTDEEIKEVMYKVCENLPEPAGQGCVNWLRKYADIVIDSLIDFTPKEICNRINVCTPSGGVAMSPGMNMMKVDDCTMCQEISSEIRKMIDRSGGSISVDDALKSVCARLPLSTAAHMVSQDAAGDVDEGSVEERMRPLGLSFACEQFVTDKRSDISDGLECNFTVQELCFFMGSCGLEEVKLKKDVPHRLHNIGLAQDSGKSKVFDGNSPTTAEQFDDGECKMCLYVVTNVKEQIPNAIGQTQPRELKSSLTGLCNYLRKPESKRLCMNYVEGTGDNVFDVLANVNPTELCILFLACPTNAAQQSQSGPEAPKAFFAAENNLSGNDMNILSSGLLKNDDNDETEKKKATTVPMPVLQTDDCTVCVNMALIVFQMVNEEIPIELDQALQRACSVIHPLYHPRCLELMDKYREQMRIRVLMFPRLSPTEYCKEFEPPVCAAGPLYGLQSASKRSSKKRFELDSNPETTVADDLDTDSETTTSDAVDTNTETTQSDEDIKEDLCELCQHAMFKVGPQINSTASDYDVFLALLDSCDTFNGVKFSQCLSIVDKYGDAMEAKLLGKPRTPYYQVCYQMDNALCSAKYTNQALRSKLMDAFLSECPRGLTGNEQTFRFASDISDFISMIMYFMDTDSVSLSSNATEATPADSTTTTPDDDDDDDDEDGDAVTTTEPGDDDEISDCEMCNEIIKEVKPYIQYEILQKFLQEEIDKSCFKLDIRYFVKCYGFVANYSSSLVNGALYDITRKKIEDICALTDPPFCPLNPLTDSHKWHSMSDLRDVDKLVLPDEEDDEKKGKDSDEDDEKKEKNSDEDNDSSGEDEKKGITRDNSWDLMIEMKKAKQELDKLKIKDTSEVIPNFVPAAAATVSDCVICEEIVANIEPNIQGSKNMEEIKDLIMRACFSIDRAHFSQCLEFLPKYGPHLRDSIIADSAVSPSEICMHTKTLACSPPIEPMAPAVPSHKQVSLDVETPGKKLHRLGSGSLTRDILLKICEHIIEKLLNGMEEICMSFIDKHFPEENNYGGSLALYTGVKDCDVCQEMVTVVSMAKNYQTGWRFSLHDSLYESCKFLPTSHRWLCQGVLRKYGEEMEPYLENHPSSYINVCDDLRPAPCYQVAPNESSNDENDSNDDADDDNNENIMRRRFINQVLTQHRVEKQLSLSPNERHDDYSPDCLVCQDMVKEIRKRLMMDHSKSIKDATEDVCQYLPQVARHNCSEIVLASGSKIEEGLKWFVYDSPSYVCEQSELCDPYRIDTDSKDPCKEGPDFWCMSFQNAEQCDQIEYCQAKFRTDDD